MATCQQCNAVIPPQRGRGARRRYCLTCSPPRPSAKAQKAAVATSVVALPLPATSTTEAVARELETAGAADTVAGQMLLALAGKIDDPAESAAGVAAAVKAFLALHATVIAPALEPEDELDRIRRRVNAKFAGHMVPPTEEDDDE